MSKAGAGSGGRMHMARHGFASQGGRFAGLAACCAVLLAGCDVAQSGRIRSIAILDGAVTAAAPAGYCISPGAGMRGEDSAVILIDRKSTRLNSSH